MDLTSLEEQAKALLDPRTYGYFAGGADDELTVADNVAAWRRLKLRPRVLRDVGTVSTATTLLGAAVAAPILVAPMAYQRLAHDEGEAATARGSSEGGSLMVVSTFATVSLEEVAAAAPATPRWFQMYVHTDRGLTESLVRRAANAGYGALVLTVDFPVIGYRRRDEIHNFDLPEGMVMANLQREVPRGKGSGLAAYAAEAVDPGVTFDDIGWLSEVGGLPVVVKGVLRGDDAAAAVDSGAAAIMVSNHGGRQLDGAISTADALSDVVEAVAGRAEVYVDGGIRSGGDVVKALAMGARAVGLGRPVLWGLATGGAAGVRDVLAGFAEEVQRAMALCGATAVTDIDRSLVV